MAKKKKSQEVLIDVKQMVEEPVEQVIEEVIEEDDPTTKILKEYANFWNENCAGHSVTKIETAQVLWSYWQQVSGRTDRFFGCTPCVVTKLRYMKKLCEERGIEIK